MIKRSISSQPVAAQPWPRYIYAGLFTTELILKICAEGREFLWSEEWAWNYLDATRQLDATPEVQQQKPLQKWMVGRGSFPFLGGGFKCFLCLPLLGEDSHCD